MGNTVLSCFDIEIDLTEKYILYRWYAEPCSFLANNIDYPLSCFLGKVIFPVSCSSLKRLNSVGTLRCHKLTPRASFS